MAKIVKFIINSPQAALKEFNGQACSRDLENTVEGVSGTTKLYNLTAGGALFLRDDEVKQEK